jgi:hypothetical protein
VHARSTRVKLFSQGLVSRVTDITWLVESCCSAWKQTDPSIRTLGLLIGILEEYAVSDRTSYELFLDRLMVDADFSIVFPCIQLGLDINDQAVERLIACILLSTAPLGSYRNLGHASVVSRIDRDRLLLLLIGLQDAENGDLVIVDSLSLLVSLSGCDQLPVSFMEFARGILARQDFSRSIVDPSWDYDLERIAKASLSGEQGAEVARIVSTNLLAGILDYSVTGYRDYPRLMDSLATCQPAVFLDVFLGSRFDHQGMIGRIFDSASWHDNLGHRYNSLGLIDNEYLLGWCEADPDHRFSALAEAVKLCCFTPNESGRPDLSWSPLALELLSKAPRVDDILKAFVSVFFPQSWTGSRADMIAERLPLLHSLEQHLNPVVATWASTKHAELTHYVADLRVKEEQAYGAMSQRFE